MYGTVVFRQPRLVFPESLFARGNYNDRNQDKRKNSNPGLYKGRGNLQYGNTYCRRSTGHRRYGAMHNNRCHARELLRRCKRGYFRQHYDNTLQHVKHLPRAEPTAEGEKGVPCAGSLYDIFPHSRNVYAHSAVFTQTLRHRPRLDLFRHSVGSGSARSGIYGN